MFNRLLDLLRKQERLIDELLEVNLQKERALLDEDTDKLQSLLTREQDFVSELSKLEALRVDLIEEIKKRYSVDFDEGKKIAFLCDDDVLRKELLRVIDSLRSKFLKLKVAVEINNRLCNDILKFKSYIVEEWKAYISKKLKGRRNMFEVKV